MYRNTAEGMQPYRQLAALQAEQLVVQANKYRTRTLEGYNAAIFPGYDERPPYESAIFRLIQPLCQDSVVSLENLFVSMRRQRGRDIVWTDLACGIGIAQRQLAIMPEGGGIKRYGIDLLSGAISNLEVLICNDLERRKPGIMAPEHEPVLLIADAESVVLPEAPDVVTCIEGQRYFNNPFGVLVNAYNQLQDYGVVFFAGDDEWSGLIRLNTGSQYQPLISVNLLQDLRTSGLPYAATNNDELRYRREIFPEKSGYLTSLAIIK